MVTKKTTAKETGKTLIVNSVNHKTLYLMKIQNDFSSIDDLISYLISRDIKLKEIESQEKQAEQEIKLENEIQIAKPILVKQEKKKNGK